MKLRLMLTLLLLSASAFAQQTVAQNTGAHKTAAAAANGLSSKIDPAKEADIRRLLEVGGTKALAMQMMTGMEKNLKPLMMDALPPGEYRERLVQLFLEKFQSKVDSEQFLNLAVPVYDKYLSDDEIKGLINFYSTPLGQKTVDVMPKMMAECQEVGQKWGQQLGRDSMIEVISEHPEFQKQIEASRNGQQSK